MVYVHQEMAHVLIVQVESTVRLILETTESFLEKGPN